MSSSEHYPNEEVPEDGSQRSLFSQEESVLNPSESMLVSDSVAPEPDGGYSKWVRVVERIRNGEDAAVEELYATFSRGIRFYLIRHMGMQELDDRVHDAFLIVLQAIRAGTLREPERLMGFVRTVVRRQVAAHIEQAVQHRKEHAELEMGSRVADHAHNPEEQAIRDERAELMSRFLDSISPRDREILTRFYLYGQSQSQICREMNLTETQFRLLKSRAKGRFGALGKKQLASGPVKALRVRYKVAGEH